MGAFGALFVVAYVVCVIGVIIYVLSLMTRFVRAQERVAGAAETIARKLREEGKT